MRKLLLILTAVIFAATAALQISAGYYDETLPRVVDHGELLTEWEEENVERALLELGEIYSLDFAVMTASTSNGQEIKHFAADFYDYEGYGVGEDRSGVMLVLVMDTREYFILTTGSCIGYFSDYDIDNIGDEIQPLLSRGDYADAFLQFAEECDGVISYELYGPEYTLERAMFSLAVSAAIGFTVAFIAVGAMKSKLKTVRTAPSAADYVDRGSVRVIESRDTFLYKTLTKVPKPRETSGGGGSSTFSGSSGRSHGGGGGRF